MQLPACAAGASTTVMPVATASAVVIVATARPKRLFIFPPPESACAGQPQPLHQVGQGNPAFLGRWDADASLSWGFSGGWDARGPPALGSPDPRERRRLC
ncbi:hypothetical protein Lesp02_72820 [Lentzea sp. NBRC 105346]|nr:hypothetical protein Lesp02_72820 [Lentzea sp. NBRC 105346]